MKDRLLLYAICISLVAHIAAVCVIGGTSASRLANVQAVNHARKSVEIDLLQDRKPIPEKQKPPVAVRQPEQAPKPVFKEDLVAKALPKIPIDPTPAPHVTRDTPPPANSVRTGTGARPTSTGRVPGNPGSQLNTGTASANGDLRGMGNGGTPVGWVPGTSPGTGKGSGTGPGVGTPDLPKNADPGPGTKPAPAPPPEPRRLTITVCSVSGLLPGKHCEHTKSETFIEGKQPGRTCDQCKEKEPAYVSRMAQKSEAELIRSGRLDTGSFPEGISAVVVISYTIDTSGDVTDVQVVQSSGNRTVDREIVRQAPRTMKYKPAMQDGVARSVKKTRTYNINT